MSDTWRQFTFNLSALSSPGTARRLHLWTDETVSWSPVVSLPPSSSTTGTFHVACFGLQSSQIKFLMRPLSVRKQVSCTLYKLFFPPTPIGESSSRLSPRSKLHPSQPSRVLKAQLRALLISSPLSRLSPSDGLLHLTPLLPQRLVFIAAVWTQWHIPPPSFN